MSISLNPASGAVVARALATQEEDEGTAVILPTGDDKPLEPAKDTFLGMMDRGLTHGASGAFETGVVGAVVAVPAASAIGASASWLKAGRQAGTFSFRGAMATNMPRLGPAVIAAAAGPLIAEGLSYVAPNV